jgi:hydroxyethylthiazole kinase-like sugar kinase family protein
MSEQFIHDAPNDLFQEIVKAKEWATSLFIKFSEVTPDRITAFNTAIEAEKTAGELHFQSIMTKESNSWLIKVLQQLNEYDRDHLKRIEAYVKEKNII